MTERYNVLTEKRVPTGRTRARFEPLAEGEYRLGAEIWIFHPDGRLMITKRSAEKRHCPGMWECTGGFVCAGETTLDTILREVREEIGLSLKEEDVRLVATERVDGQYIDLFTATADVEIASLTLQPEEVTDAKWVSLDELAAMRDSGAFIDSVYNRIIKHKDGI